MAIEVCTAHPRTHRTEWAAVQPDGSYLFADGARVTHQPRGGLLLDAAFAGLGLYAVLSVLVVAAALILWCLGRLPHPVTVP